MAANSETLNTLYIKGSERDEMVYQKEHDITDAYIYDLHGEYSAG